MLKDFFKLNTPFEEFDSDRMDSQLKTSKHIINVLYRPDGLSLKKISNTIFENVSLSKTKIEKCTFKNCMFKDCLFIGSNFTQVEFHGCQFINCNFFKSKFSGVYGKPNQFRLAIQNEFHSNIAVHLYHQLRENYYTESQREFKNEAEYFFSKWKRKLLLFKAREDDQPLYKYGPSVFASFVYDILLGYGYRLRNLLISTSVLISALITLNHCYAKYLFIQPESPSVIKSIYFTITTMATLGASGFSPLSELGYGVVTINVLIGITVLTATVNSIFRKIIR